MEYVTTRIWAAALSVLLLLVSAGAWALGLGNIEVSSTLNEPLRARISLSALQVGDLDGIRLLASDYWAQLLDAPNLFQPRGNDES